MDVKARIVARCCFVIGALFALLWQPVAAQTAASDGAALLRSAIDLACAAQTQAEIHALRRALPITGFLGRRPVTLTRIGWRGRFQVNGGWLTLERIAPGGELRRISAQYDAAEGARPTLLAMTDVSCQIRTARRLVYDDDGRPAWLEWLDDRLEPTGQREALNPPVPVHADPGGIPVALIDTGVNYLLPAISARLARDHNQDLLGYDYWDLDRRPFDAHPVHSPFFPGRHGTQTASLLLREAPVARLLPYRYPRPDMSRMAALIEDAAAHGVRLVNLSLAGNDAGQWRWFYDAARAHPDMLFVVAAGNHGRDLERWPTYPAALSLDNLLVVTAATATGQLAADANWGASIVDLMVPAEAVTVTDFHGRHQRVSGSSYATVRITALAACLLAAHPTWRTADLKAAILSLAQRAPEADRVGTGFLPNPVLASRGACDVRLPGSGV